MAEILRDGSVIERTESRSLKQVFGTVKSLEEIKQNFVFYVPFTYTLVRDPMRITKSTDVVSNILAGHLGEHPLVITDLLMDVFDAPTLILTSDQRQAARTLYTVPAQVWEAARSELQIITAIDTETKRLCLFTPHSETLTCPFGQHTDRTLDVHFFNCYGNKETYYFHTPVSDQVSVERPVLCWHPPVSEVADIASKLFGTMKKSIRLSEKDILVVADRVDTTHRQQQLIEMQKESKLHEKITAKPLTESQMSVKAKQECYDLIRQYEALYGRPEGF
jgi:hypothetical protein